MDEIIYLACFLSLTEAEPELLQENSVVDGTKD